MTISFKEKNPLEKRINESNRILNKYPDRIPVIVEKLKYCNIPNLDKNKFLVPRDLTVGQLIYVIRKRLCITSGKALFIFINNALPITSSLISDIYNKEKDIDNFLYIKYNSESTFG